ncbi:hypothetical protein CRM22_008553 [Opisthorchis felineus]|uniref:Regulator of microtubule dynamics protein 1 n=1 Tax=Opisthorchis felineus TaxID=147828 RepID=A0A4S2LIL1_OPIFE|nr:hypothetical protein CRM22_008553 [Opisthorchis felineus]
MDAKLKQSDELFWGKRYRDCDAILDSLRSDPEVHWRKARSIFAQITSSSSEPSKDTLRSTFIKGLEETDKGLSVNPKHANCLTWKGICINQIAKIEGINERIKKAYEIQQLWESALEVDPTNDLTLGCMGIWCFTVTDLPDVKRIFAKAFFKTPPSSTYMEVQIEHGFLHYLNVF